MNIDLSKVLRGWQKEFLNNFKRFNVLVIHRRAGKTVVTVLLLIIKALQEEGSYGYIAPTYTQAKKIAWKMIQKFGNQIGGFRFNSSELTCTLPNGSTITLFGAENPDSLRGLDLKGVVFDEYAQQPSTIYGEIIFPMINANKGWVTWIGTPKGKNAFYHLYQRAIKDDRFNTMLLRVSQTKLLDEEQLADARAEMTEEEYNQEYECSWEAFIKGAVYGKELAQAFSDGRVIPECKYNPDLEVETFWDLGRNDATAILFTQVVGNEVRIIDSYSNRLLGLPHYLNEVKKKPYKYKNHWFPHDIGVTEFGTGVTRLQNAIDELGDICEVVPKRTIETGINAGRILFKDVWINSELIDFLNDISLYQYEYNERLGEYGKTPKHDFTSHYADAYRYLATVYKEITKKPTNYEVTEVNVDDFFGDMDTFYIDDQDLY